MNAPPSPEPPPAADVRSRAWSKLAVWLLAMLVGLDVVKHIGLMLVDTPPPQLDALGYWDLAGQFLAGDWFWEKTAAPPIAYRTPGFPGFVMVWRALFGRYALIATQAAQHALIVATSLLVAHICWRLSRNSWLTIVSYACCLVCITRDFYGNLVLTETLFTFLVTASVAVWTRYWERPQPGWAVGLGGLIGLATLVRPVSSYLGLAFACALILGARERSGRIRAIVQGAVLLLVSQLILVPWYYRNDRVFGEPFLTRFVGRNLWAVTFPGGAGAGLTAASGPATQRLQSLLPAEIPQNLEEVRVWPVSLALRDQGMPDDEIDRLMGRTAWETQREHKGVVIERFVRRAVNFWRCVSNPLASDESRGFQEPFEDQYRPGSRFAAKAFAAAEHFAMSRNLTMNTLFTIATFLGAGLLIVCPSTRQLGWGVLFTLLYFGMITAAVEIPTYRYRLVVEPIMIASALGGVGVWLARRF